MHGHDCLICNWTSQSALGTLKLGLETPKKIGMCNVEGQKVSKFNFHVFEEQWFHSAGQWNHSMQSFGNYCHIFCHYCSYPHDPQVKVQALLPNCTRGYFGHCRDFFTFTCFAGYQPYGYILQPIKSRRLSVLMGKFQLPY